MKKQLLDQSQVKLKMGSFGTAGPSALANSVLLQKVRDYRRRLSARMIALDPPILDQRLAPGSYHISRKVDGEFTVLVWKQGEIFTLNPGGTIRVGLPFLEQARQGLESAGVTEALVVGELYWEPVEGQRSRVHDLLKVIRSPQDPKDLNHLKFAVFDLLEWEGESVAEEALDSVYSKIQSVVGEGQRVHPVQSVVGDLAEVKAAFERWVDQEGAEGVVARSEEFGWYKIKARHPLDVVVVGFTESSDDRAGLLHDLLVAVLREEGTFHLLGRVGGGFTEEQRRDFLADLKSLEVDSDYHEISSDRVAYRMVKPQWIIEISCLDLIAENTRNAAIQRMVLQWNPEDDRYTVVRSLPLASVISPQFIRRREDKTVEPASASLRQVSRRVEVPRANLNSLNIHFPASELLRREVRVKTLRGSLGVRKLLMWKTNKENEDEIFPAFVLHLTDFSPNRKDPLKREIRVSKDREQMEELWTALAEKYFVKGWEPPASSEG